ncbi:MAG: glycosyltransferase family 4 protein [Prevotellaceae bacterium]|jgi:glycosyltransferase involved in cell wall biosynthesis|nr:glycosyltransferase family 4 protein [Prevotellaceae bacterium]
MNIIIIENLFIPTLQYHSNVLIRYFMKYGHRVVVVTSTYTSMNDFQNKNYSSIESREVYNDLEIFRLPYVFKNRQKRFNGKRVTELINSYQPDLIVVFNLETNLWEVRKYKKNNPKCKVIMSFHNDFTNTPTNGIQFFVHKFIWKPFFKIVSLYIDKIYPITPNSINFLKIMYNFCSKKVELVPLGVDTEKINKIKEQNYGNEIRTNLKIGDNDFVIFTGGKFEEAKKTEILINAVLNCNNSKLHLIMAGSFYTNTNEYENKIMNIIKNNPNIHFVGWQNGEDIYKYMNAADIAVFPGSQSILWQQSIGMNLPLIIGGFVKKNNVWLNQNAEYLNENNNVIILNSTEINENTIKNHILNLMNNIELLLAMKKGAKKTTKEFLDYDMIVRTKFLDIESL